MAGEEEAERSLTGVWQGRYVYSDGDEVEFTATLLDLSGALSGSTHETAPLLGEPQTLHALLEGRVSGGEVSFVKTYQDAPPRFATVAYEGAVSDAGHRIEGRWRAGGVSGGFQMLRPRRKKTSVTRREVVTA